MNDLTDFLKWDDSDFNPKKLNKQYFTLWLEYYLEEQGA